MFVRRTSSLVGVSAALSFFGLMTFEQSVAQDVRHLCSEKYQAAKVSGTLNTETWPHFYSRCTTEENAAAAEATASRPLDIRHICSEKYEAAKAAGTLNSDTWPQFYSRCTAETKANPPAVETPAPPVAAAPAEEAPAASVAETAAPPPAGAAPTATVVAPAPANTLKIPASKPAVAAAVSAAVFPYAISPTYANEKPYNARLKTCSDQFKANKATYANGGLKWIQNGGGYWSECNKHLKRSQSSNLSNSMK